MIKVERIVSKMLANPEKELESFLNSIGENSIISILCSNETGVRAYTIIYRV